MRILFFLGNGFDLNLGMKTRYSDFYQEYKKPRPTDNDDIIKVKSKITDEIEKWSDLELAIGDYAKNFTSKNRFISVFEDMGDMLAEYLQKEEDRVDFDKVDSDKLKNHLAFPYEFLNNAEKERIVKYVNGWSSTPWRVNVITFNYTRTLEKILGNPGIIVIGKYGNQQVGLHSIEHIHGFIDDRMVMGVHDTSQISNKVFHQDLEVLEALVKPTCNVAMGHNVDSDCKLLVSQAKMICIFGSSLGDTDKMWWDLVAKQLKEGCFLIIYVRSEEIPLRREYKKAEKKRMIKRLFLSKVSLSDKEKENVESRIYVGINTDIFKLSKAEKSNSKQS